MAGAKTFQCEGGGELHVVFNTEKTSATVKLDGGEAVFLPREQKSDLEAYSDGSRTLGVSKSGVLAFTEAPAPPKVCRAAEEEQIIGSQPGGASGRDAAKQNGKPGGPQNRTDEVKVKPSAVDLPAPKAAGVTRNFTAADKGKTIDMKVGEKISISLIGIPTAGYLWAADVAPTVVKVSDGPSGPTITAQNQPGYTGGNHWEVLIIEAVKSGDGDLVLAMRRPWEKKAELDAETFTVKLKVQ